MSKSRVVPSALALLALAACSGHHERELTGWLKVDVVRPPGGSGAVHCRIATIRYYDATPETPILYAECRPPSEHQCLWLVPKPEGLVVRPVGTDRPPINCSDPKGLKVSLIESPKVEVLW